MSSIDDAVITSMAAALQEIEERIAALATKYGGADRDDLLGALHEAERQARSASRELRRALRLLS
jgi:predicted  nucleic acid-binding Zn-ribbon protein